jgi:hypothetical protein
MNVHAFFSRVMSPSVEDLISTEVFQTTVWGLLCLWPCALFEMDSFRILVALLHDFHRVHLVFKPHLPGYPWSLAHLTPSVRHEYFARPNL